MYLIAYLGRNAGKLRVGGKRGQILHGLNERGGGHAAPLAVLVGEISIQGLGGGIYITSHYFNITLHYIRLSSHMPTCHRPNQP